MIGYRAGCSSFLLIPGLVAVQPHQKGKMKNKGIVLKPKKAILAGWLFFLATNLLANYENHCVSGEDFFLWFPCIGPNPLMVGRLREWLAFFQMDFPRVVNRAGRITDFNIGTIIRCFLPRFKLAVLAHLFPSFRYIGGFWPSFIVFRGKRA